MIPSLKKNSIPVSLIAACLLLAPVCSTAKVKVYFNSQERLEKHLKSGFSRAVARAKEGKQGTIDIMIFSFTSTPLADSMLRIARDFPLVRIRILANLSQLFREPASVLPMLELIATGDKDAYRQAAENRKGFISDEEIRKSAVESEMKYLVSEFRLKPLPNIEIKYKWFPAFSWIDDEGMAIPYEQEGTADYYHFHQKAELLHHKTAIINNEVLINGSYNWSISAETKNFENLMVITGPEKQDLRMVKDFQAEFNAVWDNPQMAKTSEECIKLKEELCNNILELRQEALTSAPLPGKAVSPIPTP